LRFERGEFFGSVPDVGVGDAGVDEEEAGDLAPAFREKVQAVHDGNAADFLVGRTGRADGVGGRHDGRLLQW
jgi:hypothetical protein